ncbi:ribosome-associated translation inhibitor RaiA [Nannocystis sp. ILAH1]|uniref:ribosome hibernation-promoting factor, HPF/YfiA family n=1 Tax=unclassified Nannocystis TaxID=2627009 RepID=UPI00226D4C7E|nr:MULTISPECIES: ribosome-associated translation inhibitor RaiA [unclassified Nannocystis]MCY0990095.1 ribosome-associated translation inhibitor RaiA [Nannocystis sp. ILAH1]MCY1069616.1 ribosome-associated translation inhibitor RaiA [Nannocystis sp. RBIL2]
MQTHFVFRQMESSTALRGYAEERLEKIKRYFAEPLRVSCTFTVDKVMHIAAFDVTLRNGLQLHAQESTENMYSSVDMALAKMERQVRRYKARIKHHKGSEGRSAKVRLGVIAAESMVDQIVEEEDAAAEAAATVAALATNGNGHAKPESRPVVIRQTEVTTERMTVEGAIMQMNLLHKQFYVFTNAGSGEINVVYVREDGNYGLIEPNGSEAEAAAAT